MEEKISKQEILVISFEAPITSPEIPPKLLFEIYCMIPAIANDKPSDTKHA